jgi:predicted enzyme related to lactoylglutathione lyase
MGLKILNVTLDTGDALAASTFWAAALDWSRAEWSTEAEAMVKNPDGGHNLYFMRVPEGKAVKNRMHLDLEPTGTAREEIDRLHALGATTLHEYDGYTVLADPEGNEFCVTGELK